MATYKLVAVELTFEDQFSMSVWRADEAGKDENNLSYKKGDWLSTDQSGNWGGVTLFLAKSGSKPSEVIEALKNEIITCLESESC